MSHEFNSPEWENIIFKSKPVRNKRGGEGGAGDPFSNVMPIAEAQAAISGNRSYAPSASKALINQLSQAAERALSSGFSPSPFGTQSDFQTDMPRPIHNPNKIPESYASKNVREVQLKANDNDAYLAQGLINGHSVELLLDTGATQVVIPRRIAEFLDLKPAGRASEAFTANGTVKIYPTYLESVKLGAIELNNVKACINMNERTDQILFGMSALKQLEIYHKNGVLILRQDLNTPTP